MGSRGQPLSTASLCHHHFHSPSLASLSSLSPCLCLGPRCFWAPPPTCIVFFFFIFVLSLLGPPGLLGPLGHLFRTLRVSCFYNPPNPYYSIRHSPPPRRASSDFLRLPRGRWLWSRLGRLFLGARCARSPCPRRLQQPSPSGCLALSVCVCVRLSPPQSPRPRLFPLGSAACSSAACSSAARTSRACVHKVPEAALRASANGCAAGCGRRRGARRAAVQEPKPCVSLRKCRSPANHEWAAGSFWRVSVGLVDHRRRQ